MAQYEEYQKRVKKGQEMEYRWEQEEKGISEQKFEVGMDSFEMVDYYADRMENTSFEERTQYYFESAGLMASKSKRYRNLSEGGANVTAFANQHQNHSAKKRKRSAGKAATAFGKAAVLSDKYRKTKSKNLYDLYARREEIMRLRMEGMLAAAETKSTSDDNELYLKSKAKISCLMILRDQLKHLMKEAQQRGDTKSLEKLTKKNASIRKELINAQKDMTENLPTTDQRWKAVNRVPDSISEETVREVRNHTHNSTLGEKDVRTQMNYATIHKQVRKGKMDYPCNVVRLDRQGQPVSLADAKKLEWNRRYQKAEQDGDEETVKTMKLESLKRIRNYDLPSTTLLRDRDMNELFRLRPAEFYEMFISAPKFIQKEMQDGGAVKEAIEADPVLRQKVNVILTLGDLMKDNLEGINISVKSGSFTVGRRVFNEEKRRRYAVQVTEGYRALNERMQQEKQEQENAEPKPMTLAEEKAEYEQLKREKNGNLTEDGYRIYRGFRDEVKMYTNPTYLQITADYGVVIGKGAKGLDLSRTFGCMLRAVHYDKEGKPISKRDREMHEQNNRWMNSWVVPENETEEQKKKREETQREIVEKEIPTIFEGFEFPEPEDLMDWAKKMLTEKPFEFAEMLKRSLAYDAMAELCPPMKEYRDTHLAFQKKLNVAFAVNSMIPMLSQSEFGVNTAVNEGAIVVDSGNQEFIQGQFHDPESFFGYERQHKNGYTEQFNQLRPIQMKEKADRERAEAEELEKNQINATEYKQFIRRNGGVNGNEG